jgi:hypothetical protein
VAPGTYDFSTMLGKSRAVWPEVFNRFTFTVREAE